MDTIIMARRLCIIPVFYPSLRYNGSSMALALYRKYRPKTVAEIIGQESVSVSLLNAAKADKIGHAYLFYGPRGSGKTTAARIVAKLANCEKRAVDPEFRKKGEPCNECRACREIDEGRALDVIEIDAASNRGIDEIRSLKEGIRLAPTSYRYKVFLIDEVHQLTKEAFNALLKTLEEPPAHAIFVLATTEYDKLPATIVSRTQRFGFKKIPVGKIIDKLKRIATAEKIKISNEALEVIAIAADGGFRDAESLFEQVVSLEDKEITLSEVERILGRVGAVKTAVMAEELITRNKEALVILSEIASEGYNLNQLVKDLILYIRRVLVLAYNEKMEDIFKDEMTPESLSRMKEMAKNCDKQKTVELIRLLIRAYGEMKYSPFAIVPLEVAIVEALKE
ncbi:MAG: DNA polymerase III subunit gamma/tau [Candidatus Colwellbacteria bacterium]|nr:DNA polymerase III subunit gamma/tau [Candidatus Colwellbacteria bacterium]